MLYYILIPTISFLPCVFLCAYLDAMDKRSKEEHKQLHGGHALVEELRASVLILLQRASEPGAEARARPRPGARPWARGGAPVA